MKTLKRDDFPHIDEFTLELVSTGRGSMYKTKDEIIMSVANNLDQRLPCGCAGMNYYVVRRDNKNILEKISEVDFREKDVLSVIYLDIDIKNSLKIFLK